MIAMMLLAMTAGAEAKYEPPWETWYHQGVGCAASAMVAKGRDPTGGQVGEIMTWGMILAEAGRKAGRSKEQVDSGDVETAFPFYQRMKAMKPKAFAAHRAYCRAVLDADRP
jgi:hypothetical protein